MLPIGPTGGGNSPYQSSSAFAGNPYLISPDLLVKQGLLERGEVTPPPKAKPGKADYGQAQNLKDGWLKNAFTRFENKPKKTWIKSFEEFVSREAFWLDDFSLFIVLKEKKGTQAWTRWDEGLRDRRPEALAEARKTQAGEIRYHQFVQWLFAEQWKELRALCRKKGIGLIGDIPMFVAHDSSDTWSHREIFKMNPDGSLPGVAGVPPDYFSPDGQVWGMPLFDWEALKAQGYRWWIERFKTAFRRFDLNRLDHFIGFVRAFEVPAGEKTAVKGTFQPGGGAPFFEAVRAALGSLPFIAEDLGLLTDEVEALRDQFQLPGMGVLQFDFNPEPEKPPFRLPRPENSVVYTGTHDNDTTAGWYGKLDEAARETLCQALGVGEPDVVWALVARAMAAPADLAILPLQDLLGLGLEDRMNTPGTAEGNWEWRLKEGALSGDLAQRVRALTLAFGRLGKDNPA
jgi:4-alpha-glucanotransferase